MSTNATPHIQPQPPTIYQIRIEGHLPSSWSIWFGGLNVTRETSGDTLLTGSLHDQAALYGLLRKVRDLGLPLISVMRVSQ